MSVCETIVQTSVSVSCMEFTEHVYSFVG